MESLSIIYKQPKKEVRMLLKLKETGRTNITSPEAVYRVLSRVLKSENQLDRDKEHFWAIGLTTRSRIKYVDLVSLGTLNASLVHPRELFRTAIKRAVSSMIVAHNHPSGDPEPSSEDTRITTRIREAGSIIGIDVLDHVIIAGGRYTSFKERNGGLL